jgi:myo-inositol 2-dehydrogenase / D-chiro-inositol 1-dehydrogenase
MTTKVGLVGAGNIGLQHARVLSKLDGVEIAAVVDVDPQRAADVAAEFGAKSVGSVEDALPHIDAAYVLTPPRQRVEVVRTLAEAGKAVFCEKPLAGTVEDAEAIRQIVADTGIPFMMGFMRRYSPTMLRMKEVLDSGVLGQVRQISYQRLEKQQAPAGNWRIVPEALVGMAVESVSHDVDLLRYLFGEIAEAKGYVLNSSGLAGFNDDLVATLKFDSGVVASLQVTWNSDIWVNSIGIYGTGGALIIDGGSIWNFDRMRVKLADGSRDETITFDPNDAGNIGMAGENQAFVALLAGDTADYPTVDDGVATLVISRDITESNGGVVNRA